MSRTSRRISRSLIAALGVVIVLSVVFTLHKVHKAHADESLKTQVATVSLAPTPALTAHPAAAPAPANPIAIKTPDAQADANALVTQTPTEKTALDGGGASFPGVAPMPASPAPASPSASASPTAPTATASPTTPTASASPAAPTQVALAPAPQTEAANSAPAASDENDAAALRQWASGAKPAAPQAPATDDAISTHDAVVLPTSLSAHPLIDAKTKLDTDDLIGARQILNEALIAGRGDPAEIKKQIEAINQTLIFSARKFTTDPWGGSYQVASGERLGSIAARHSVTWELLSRINGVTPKRLRSGQTIKIVKGPFYAIVYKQAFRMELYLGAPGGEGSMFVRSFPVGLGKNNSTPTGLWMCRAGDKIRNPRYYPPHGGDVIAANDPKNPLGGYWIAIEGLQGQALGQESYGIHGTIDPDSIGKTESMGCIRLRADDISWVFDLLVDGKSKVLVKD